MRGIQKQRVVEVEGYRSTGLERTVLEGEPPIQQQGAKEVGGYRSTGLERTVLEGELPWGYNSRGLKQ